MYLSVDHRVIDGGPAARAIRALEATLNGPVLDELRALAGRELEPSGQGHVLDHPLT